MTQNGAIADTKQCNPKPTIVVTIAPKRVVLPLKVRPVALMVALVKPMKTNTSSPSSPSSPLW